MNALSRLICTLAGASLLVVGGHWLLCCWVDRAQGQSTDLVSNLFQLGEAHRLSGEMDVEQATLRGRLQQKREIIQLVRSGELSLHDAAQAFLQMHDGKMYASVPGKSEYEKAVNNVVLWALPDGTEDFLTLAPLMEHLLGERLALLGEWVPPSRLAGQVPAE